MWLDGIFMADSFYAERTKEFDADNTAARDDIMLQYDLIESRCRNTTSNLLHGYADAKDTVWGRAVGWYYISLAEATHSFPEAHDGRARLVEYFVALLAGLEAADARDGGWWLVMSEPYPGAEGNNIESSAHAMFTYGLLGEEEYRGLADRAFQSLVDDFVTENEADDALNLEGTVEVGSLSSNGTYNVSLGLYILGR